MKASINMEIPELTVKLCEEDRARLDTIIDLLKGGTGCHCKDNIVQMPAPVEPEKAPAEPEPAPEATKPAEPREASPAPEQAKEEPKTEAPAVSVDELRSKVVQLVSKGKKAETKAIINDYAGSVGDIPADKRAEALERLKALEG